MVWPSPLKFIAELEADAKALLEAALMEANREREKRILGQKQHKGQGGGGMSAEEEESESEEEEACNICFEQACSMEVKECGHQMCAACTLALCCHSKPNPKTLLLHPPSCPFCRTTISRLVVATKKPRLSRRRSRSSSFKGLSSAMGSLCSFRLVDGGDLAHIKPSLH
uniref:RING-type E3 ubiquitin transferase n=2 Tax=Oryza brachyantha TaxID=4533 RepID=J3L8D0_ORYBR